MQKSWLQLLSPATNNLALLVWRHSTLPRPVQAEEPTSGQHLYQLIYGIRMHTSKRMQARE